MDAANVRVNAQLLPNFKGKIVRVIGKIESIDQASGHALLSTSETSSPASQIHVQLPPTTEQELTAGKKYEIVGKTNDHDSSVRLLSIAELGDAFDLEVADKFVTYTHKLPDMF
ncbi:hypothetical protein BABINDRAFT_162449 [Babjeviella inositovora NRRL Y-12698]|uniref:Replication factor A protein 3 n=1 Tax=Babjeviella inositovora NRRL Y-12698 TaxID=984486 RepID=A0A1E3QM50_9ASCO|nr:uncharacterized protein BABINDRAFT_162449 [Babjeviella inositovora NRRL Y-12698]ODQ78761.1 hypothetical protein BABINDRAFT_162449 [Babjeviella inositovora NRRL Y-12698]